MFQLRVTVDAAAFRRSAQSRFKDLRSALDDAVLYLANSARKRLSEATREVFDKPSWVQRYKLLGGGRRQISAFHVAGDMIDLPSWRRGYLHADRPEKRPGDQT